MGLGEVFGLAANVLVNLKADNSDLKAKLKEVQGIERETVRAQIEANNARNASYENWAKNITKANVALGVLTTGVQFAADAFKKMDEHNDLAQASARYSMDGLRKASAGLKTDMELMRLGAVAANSTFKLTQGQLENATKAMRAFEEAGFDEVKVANSVREAILKGNIEPLKQLGVNLDMAKGKSEQFAQVQAVLAGKANDVAGAAEGEGDSIKRASVEWQNAITKIQVSIGELVVSMGPLIERAGQIAGFAAKVVGAAVKVHGVVTQDIYTTSRQVSGDYEMRAGEAFFAHRLSQEERDRQAQARFEAQEFQKEVNARVFSTPMSIDWTRTALGFGRTNWLQERVYTDSTVRKKGGGRKRDKGGSGGIGRYDQEYYGGSGGRFDLGFGADPSQFAGGPLSESGMDDLIGAKLDKLTETFVGKKSLIESIFGPANEIDVYAEKFGVLGDVVGAFSSALSSGFSAWVSGSKSAKEALRDLVGDTLKGIATSMFGKALEHGAAAIGALALGNIPGAATHGKAAGLYAAGAVAVGGLARAYGQATSGGGGASAGAGAPAVSSGAAPVRSGPSNITVIMGGAQDDDSPRFRAQRAARAIDSARRYRSSDDDAVIWG